MENQVYHIQSLLVDELNRCKGKGNSYTDNYIKEIQDTYMSRSLTVDFIFIFIFIFCIFHLFSIFRTTWVRVDWSCHHISHNLMA